MNLLEEYYVEKKREIEREKRIYSKINTILWIFTSFIFIAFLIVLFLIITFMIRLS